MHGNRLAGLRDFARRVLVELMDPYGARRATRTLSYPNVTVDGRDWEHYDRHGPGCWHPVGRAGPCRSWQGLLKEAELAAAFRVEQAVRARQDSEEEDSGV